MDSVNVNGQQVSIHSAAKITFKVEGNPKLPDSAAHARYERYMKAATVQEYFKLGGTKGDLQHDHQHGFLSIEGVPDA